jgi:type II restriction enzyme
MNLDLALDLASKYKSASQIARIVSEHWASQNLYCPACDSNKLNPTPINTRAVDLSCPRCLQVFQLKSGRFWNQNKIVDAAYSSMIAAIRSDKVPNLIVMQYTNFWRVSNVLLIPYFFLIESAIQQRTPLGPNARRKGWVGCNILLSEIPADGKLQVVTDGVISEISQIRKQFSEIRPFSKLNPDVRGWALDVLKAVRRINKVEFTLSDIYAFEEELTKAHPSNKNIRPKIRQQLQKLRDFEIVKFLSPGRYRLLG